MPFKKGKSGNPSGLPKGTKHRKTLEKEQARALLREMVMAQLQPMTEAQIANANGIKFLVVREKKSGKFIKRITDPAGEITLDPEREIVEIWAKDPSVQAFADLMNRTIDKPTEQQLISVEMPQAEAILARLVQGRDRADDGKPS